ncbi:MAG: prepilin-type N-terminal cleavage/methylation domain-containing protein [Geminocystis sp.]|nr:prepilin-type N-terminal cleavage/methylation domain-containing protein [Geminocystis sp.]HIK36696.1 prepilin-type N-terminal cleavage/methylation domain-containing protein [Geminocystis sp. M7585_C2015_104]MCS7146775.1 prepilin-type N-terminal cleavage/methylation domain-containing protein [Geminocystis sp.]MCX8077075.1 prepilin-type N-terminal cleavage/methylation domain-containing protein [Geminocystis sp.]MDW8115601.1 prepilin-type N-terminal cleavage/methylation domain-containing protei
MRPSTTVSSNNTSFQEGDGGFTLLEVVVVVVILSIASALAVPNLLESQRQEKVKQTFSEIRGALSEAQINAIRRSGNCTVTVNNNGVTGNPQGCILERITIDSNVVHVNSTRGNLPVSITFNYNGEVTVGDIQTIHIRPKNSSGQPMPQRGYCIVIANTLGMIRTGVYDPSTPNTNCSNVDNLRYQ